MGALHASQAKLFTQGALNTYGVALSITELGVVQEILACIEDVSQRGGSCIQTNLSMLGNASGVVRSLEYMGYTVTMNVRIANISW